MQTYTERRMLPLTFIREITKDRSRWLATVAEYPAAMSRGNTLDEAIANALDAMKELMAVQREKAVNDASRAGDTP